MILVEDSSISIAAIIPLNSAQRKEYARMDRLSFWLWIVFIPCVIASFVLEYRSRKSSDEEENKL